MEECVMKITKSRKLLIGIIVACLLVGVAVAAVLIGMQNGGTEQTLTEKKEKTTKTEDTKVWLFEFSGYTGENADPGGYLSLDIVEGETYTFSFDYCVVGETMGTTIINAAQAWGLGSNVTFTDNELQGKGTYTVTFTADWPYLYPVFQSHIAFGAPELYVWNLSLYKEGDERNLISYVTLNHFKGDLAYEGLISLVDVDPDTLVGTVVEIPEDPVWHLDFSKYKGESTDPGAYINRSVEVGSKYTFCFDYCVVGESTGVTVINAAKEWGMGSNVEFTNNQLQGKGTYTITFTADYPSIYPVFQCHTPKGAPELYLWNISLVKEGSDENLFGKLVLKSFGGSLAKEGLVSLVDINPSVLKGTTVKTYKNPTWLFDFSKYTGKENDPGAYTSVDVEVGATYTFSFDYCVEGESLGTTVINAAKEWGMGSKVAFTNNKLSGKGTYSITFKADYPKLYPVFQTHTPYGTPKLYVWNMKLVKSGDSTNLFGEMTDKSFSGELQKAGLVSIVDVDTSKLTGTVVKTYENPTWLFDFSKYTGSQTDPGAYTSIDVESGSKYTFSFDYCVVGNSTGTTVVNAAKEWGMGSNVEFTNNKLTGKGTYTVTFTADYPKIYPVFQTHTPFGTPELYVWNMKLVKSGDSTNLFGEMTAKSFTGELAKAGLVSIVDVDTDALVGTTPDSDNTNTPSETVTYIGGNTWFIDFTKYEGSDTDPSVYFPVSVEKDAKYTFTFDYCVVGSSTGTSVINIKQAWGQGSNVAFTDNQLTGKGTYTITFTADMGEIMPAFTTHIPYGTPELYVWNLSLVKEGTDANMLDETSSDKLGGLLNTAGLVTVSDVDTNTLEPSQGEEPEQPDNPENPDENTKDVWLFDFENYEGTEANPGARCAVAVEQNAEYTFSFEYCVVGETTNTSVINVKQAWGLGSNIDFYQKLNGKGTYTITFTADMAEVIPAFQTEKAVGTPKLYVWDMKLVKTGSETNLLADKTVDDFVGVMKNEGLVTVTEMDPSTLGQEEVQKVDVWKFDFVNFNDASNTDPGARCPVDVEQGQEYTFSFQYYVKGESTGTTVINAAQAWGLGSNVEFTNNNLQGKGTYTITFTADYGQLLPTFQTHTPYGKPELYVWDMKLVKTGNETNLLAGKTVDNFIGVMKNNGLVTVIEMDPSTLDSSSDE